jgi:hypothetical protein
MSGSSLIVAVNALMLKGLRLPTREGGEDVDAEAPRSHPSRVGE